MGTEARHDAVAAPGREPLDNIKLLGTYVTRITLLRKGLTNKFVNIFYICWRPAWWLAS
jgi:hypothetical protein